MDQNDFSFETKIKNADIYGLMERFCVPNVDIDIVNPVVTVKWELEFEARNHGIKSILRIIQSVTCEIEWEVREINEFINSEEKQKLIEAGGVEYNNDTISGIIEINSEEPYDHKDWKIEDDEFTFRPDGQCIPSDCEIDFNKMTIKIIS